MLVRPLIAILLLLVYTCTGTTFRQLQKAPVLIAHFREHKILEKDINFLEFLARHYLNGNAKDADFTRDQQLPLKGSNFIISAAVFFMPTFFPILNFTPPVVIQDYCQVLNENFRPSQFLSQIWQPPKSC